MVYVAVFPATTVAEAGDTSTRKSVTTGMGLTVAVTVDPLLNVTVALFPRPVGAATVGVTTMLTVAVALTASASAGSAVAEALEGREELGPPDVPHHFEIEPSVAETAAT